MANIQPPNYDNPQVHAAVSPSLFWHHHGPIRNPNPGYGSQHTKSHRSTAINNGAPGAQTMSKVNGWVCWVAVNGDQMCGRTFNTGPAYWRHMRQEHCGCVLCPDRTNPELPERIAGDNALKKYVLDQKWREARFVFEPGRGPIGGPIDAFATALETIAAANPGFRSQFGRRFHRDSVHVDSVTPIRTPGNAQRFRGSSPPSSPPPSPTPAQRQAREGRPDRFYQTLGSGSTGSEYQASQTTEIQGNNIQPHDEGMLTSRSTSATDMDSVEEGETRE